MKVIKIIFFIFIYSFNANAAFTETEINQLDEINKKSIEKSENSKHILEVAIKKTIEHLPKERERILDLEKSWNITIKKKCKVMIFSSLNTDAETAEENSCLSSEYLSAANFFENLNY
ncbi:hypothetical protein COO59_00110 [Mixta theicola]|uniref:Lysozyme inhibitor LprI N-terminal domain-containing protein n=1 Tax=Mixta theicola TaxID=1458355 RepID=A0A2K1QE15_9GAMM|nr:hypothetical protein [Mixta theicola]PNS13271.1 hypothetical protein COO59_00110 [Mixta theicola]GLR08991.1 hypothetical protein GCM10007905_17110 [Mixta theicola]